jgi:hypothetical protein
MDTKRKRDNKRKWDNRRNVIAHADEIADETADNLVRAHLRKLIDLRKASPYKPGSRDKLSVMRARYSLGLPLFATGDVNHNEACLIHCTTLPLDRPTFAACQIFEVAE